MPVALCACQSRFADKPGAQKMQCHADGTAYATTAAAAEKPDLIPTSRGAGANWSRPKPQNLRFLWLVPMHEYPDQPSYTDQNKVTLDESVAAIKQAFADEGYRHNLAAGYWSKEAEGKGLMTGQEWYNRFEKELPRLESTIASIPIDAYHKIHKAAKKAAGL